MGVWIKSGVGVAGGWMNSGVCFFFWVGGRAAPFLANPALFWHFFFLEFFLFFFEKTTENLFKNIGQKIWPFFWHFFFLAKNGVSLGGFRTIIHKI